MFRTTVFDIRTSASINFFGVSLVFHLLSILFERFVPKNIF